MKTVKISTRLLLMITLVVALVGTAATLVVHWRMKAHARDEAQAKAMIMLDRNLAIHTYFTHQLKPVLFDTMPPDQESAHFEPVWMSSTYAVREMEKYYQSLTDKQYYYKECAINARSPENEADDFERAFIERLNRDPQLNEYAALRKIDGDPYFVVLRRGEVMAQSCLRCHSTPEVAPSGLVERYGPVRSFHRDEGEVISAISVRIPLGEAYAGVNRVSLTLSALFASALVIAVGALAVFGKRWIFDPLHRIRTKAIKLSTQPEHLGERIDVSAGLELAVLTDAFNEMSLQLRRERDQLEARIEQRTEALNRSNINLRKEADERQRVITELEAAFKEIKTLRGILPICAYCKKIRDDQGYWKKIESYIQEHSEAAFSHGICQECARKHYPGLDINDEPSE